MTSEKKMNKVQVLIVGAGPAGLICALSAKKNSPELEICVIDKEADSGNHNLSGALLERAAAQELMKYISDESAGKEIFGRTVKRDDILFLSGRKLKINIGFLIRAAGFFKLGIGKMRHEGDHIVSISALSCALSKEARKAGIEVLTGFAAEDIIIKSDGKAAGVKLADQGLDKDRNRQPNFTEGELIEADVIVLAEGCDGLVTERFVEKAGLRRKRNQLYSLGVKEIIKVSEEQYNKFGDNRAVHSLGYPIWTPFLGPGMFGGGLMYSYGNNSIAVGMIAGLDWKEYDFNPQDALTHFKNHPFVSAYIKDGNTVEAGAKMIPEGGYYAIPRDPASNTIGKGNVLLLGDCAGFVDMQKIKGLHNAVLSGIIAGNIIPKTLNDPETAAADYTAEIEKSGIMKEMKEARKFRQAVARLGNLIGFSISVFGSLIPLFRTEPDYLAMTKMKYKYKGNREFDKDTFTALANTDHRHEQPSHLTILDSKICQEKCRPAFREPCVTFCPAGVYENINGTVKPANPSNCLHCKTCQRKCPFNNIRWTVPEGGGGPKYKMM